MNSEKHRQAYHKSRLGRILVKKGYLTGQQLDSALERMENPSQRLGEYLVDQQLITRWQLRRALSSQSQLRLAASLSMALLSPVQLMAAGEESAEARPLVALIKSLLESGASEGTSFRLEYDPIQARAEFRNDGQIRLRLPSSLGELSFDCLKLKKSPLPDDQPLALADIDLSEASFQVRTISELF